MHKALLMASVGHHSHLVSLVDALALTLQRQRKQILQLLRCKIL